MRRTAITLKLVYAFIFLGLCVSCNEDTIEPAGEGSIRGVVISAETEKPLAAVSIATNPATLAIVTDEQGKFVIPAVPGGSYAVAAKKTGYKMESVNVAVQNRQHANITIVLGKSTDGQLAPNPPANPVPAHETRNSGITETLRWYGSDPNKGDVLTYDVYLYESNVTQKKKIAEGLQDTSVVVNELKYQTTYFWQVVAKDDQGNVTNGPVWSFSTADFPEARYLFARSEAGNYDIYSATGGEVFRLTKGFSREWWPVMSPRRNEIAYTSNIGVEPQIYIMNRDGSNARQVTTIPVAGYHNQGIGFAWAPDGGQLLYANYDNLYLIERDGSGLKRIAQAPANRHFRMIDWTDRGNKIVVQTIGSDINQSEIYVMNADGSEMTLVVENLPGRVECPVFSIDGTQILYTRDADGFENAEGRQLNAHIFRKKIDGSGLVDLSTRKPAGTNDLYPRFSPDGAKVIFVNTPNDGHGPYDIWMMDAADGQNRVKLFSNAIMPDWK